MNSVTRYFAIIPAAGIGTRMGSDQPKQYLTIAGKTLIEYAIAPFVENPQMTKVIVALHRDDQHWQTLPIATHPKIITTIGGAERYQSVACGLQAIAEQAQPQDWVLIHDAARPLLSQQDLDHLMATLHHDSVGGLLASPINATLKQANDEQRVSMTVSRDRLWQALTPQMFRYELLQQALAAVPEGFAPTDSAQALELLGYTPRLVEGSAQNIKVTRPSDLTVAKALLMLRNSCA